MSKRQGTLFERLKSAKKRYIKTKKALNIMLLHKIHNDGVYTPDQFNRTYISRNKSDELIKKAKLNHRGNNDQQSSSDDIPSLVPNNKDQY